MDQEQLRKQLEKLNADVDALMAPAPKPAPAKPQAPAPAEAPAQGPVPAQQTPAAVAPSAPAAGAQTQVTPSSYKTYVEYEYVGEPDPESDAGLLTEEMNYTAGQGAAPAPAQPGDTRSNIDKIISGERTATSRRYLPKFAEGDNVLLTVKGKPAAVIRIKAIYGIAGSENGQAILQDLKSGTEIRKPIAEMAAAEGYDLDSYSKKIYNAAVAPEGATSPVPEQGGLPVPPQGETPDSVAPMPVSGESMVPPQAPEKMTTAATPDQGMPTDMPDFEVSDEDLRASVPEATMTQDDMINMENAPKGQPSKWVRPVTEAKGRRIAVIGSAGRGSPKWDGERLTKADWDAMVEDMSKRVRPDDVLVSGGAAWADHIAVRLFLDGKVGGLILHMPNPQGEVDGTSPIVSKAGKTAMYYHKKFSEKVYGDEELSQNEILEAIEKGAVVTYEDGTRGTDAFKDRNGLVAQSAEDGMAAYTFDPEQDGPGDGGTADTWRKSKLAREKKRSIDIRKISPADPEEAFRVAKAKNKSNMRNIKRGDLASRTEEESAVKRISKLLTLGKRSALSPTEIEGLNQRVVRALRRTPMVIDDEVTGIAKTTSDSPAIASAGARMRIGDYINSFGEILDEVTRSGEREAFIARLEEAGIPRDVLESASAGDDDARQFKPFFSSERGLTVESADQKNIQKAKRMLAEAVADLRTLQETGRLRALTHPSVAEGLDFLIRNINAYRIDMASGSMSNTQISPGEEGEWVSKFYGPKPGMKSEQSALLFRYLKKVMEENNADPKLIAEIEARLLPGEVVEEYVQSEDERTTWSYTDPDTNQTVTSRDVLEYGNGSTRGYRKYALDRVGIVPPEWIIVDQAGLNIQDGYDGGPFLNEKASGSTTKAQIGFIVEPNVSAIPDAGDSQVSRSIRMAFAEYYLHRMGIHDPELRKKIVNRGGGIDMQQYIPYTRNHASVGGFINDKLINEVVRLGRIRVWEIPSGAGGKMFDSLEAGGRRLNIASGGGMSYFVTGDGDPADQLLERLMSRYKDVEGSVARPGAKAPRGVMFEGDARDIIKIDPVVFQAVRHTIPMRHPEGVRFVQGGFAPAVVADAYVRRLTAFADELDAEGLDSSKTRKIIEVLSNGVFIDEDFNTSNTFAATGATNETMSPSSVSSSGSPVLILPDENGKYPDRREMIDGIRLSDPFVEFERMDFSATEQTVNLDKAYRIMREVEEAQSNGVDRPLADDEVELLGRFEEELNRSWRGDPEFFSQVRISAGFAPNNTNSRGGGSGLGATPSTSDTDIGALVSRMSVSEYDFDLQNETLEDGPLADLSSDYRDRLTYSEPRVAGAKTSGGRIFAPSGIPDLSPVDQQIVNRIVRNLAFVFRYHSARATWWNKRGKNSASNRDAAILSELANEFRQVVEIAYEPNLRSAALMTGFARKVERLLGSDALAEDLWPEFVKMLGSRKEVDSDRSWLDPSLFLAPKEVGLQAGDPIINLYREYVGTQIGSVAETGERPTVGMGMVGEQVDGVEGDPEYRQPEQKTAAQEAELIPLSYFSEIETRPDIPAAPYEAVSEADYGQEMDKINARVAEENSNLARARERLVELRSQLAALDPKADRYNETRMSVEGQIRSVSTIVDGFPARIKGLRDQRAKVKSDFAGSKKLSKKFVVGASIPEGPAREGSFRRALQAIIDSSTRDGKVNTKMVANKLMVAWSVISTHYAVDRNSPITKINTNRDSTHFKYGLTMMLNAGHAVEMNLEQMFPETFTDQKTSEIIDPMRNLVDYLNSISDPGAEETVIGDLEGANPDEIDKIANSESFNWLKAILRENKGKITAVWQPGTQKIWLYPAADLSTKEADGNKLRGSYAPDLTDMNSKGELKTQKITGTQTMTADEAQRMIDDLGLSQVVEVVRSPELVEGVAGREIGSGIVPYKIVSKTPAVRQGSKTLVKAGSQSVDSSSPSRLLDIIFDYQLRANFLGSMMDLLRDMGVDVSEDISPKIKPISLDEDGVIDLAKEANDKHGDPIGPFAMGRFVSGDEWRNSDDIVRLRLGYPEPVRRVMDDLITASKEGRVQTTQGERDIAELIDSQIKASSVVERKPGRGKVIGYGVGGTLAGIAAGYIGNRLVLGEEAAAESMPANIGFESIGAIPKIGGPVASVAALGLTAATGGDIWRTVANLAGGLAGGAIGGALGAIGGPAGAFAGSAALGTAGSFAADGLYTSIFGDNSPSQYTVPANVAADTGKVGGETENFVDNPMKSVNSTLDQQLKIFGG